MLELLNETGLIFNSGQQLSSASMNKLNETINQLVKAVNTLMKGEINVNIEEGTKRMYTFEEALALVPKERRLAGVKLTYLGDEGLVTYTYQGGDWEDTKSWGIEAENIIDGGTW